jgi:hypothetical protein
MMTRAYHDPDHPDLFASIVARDLALAEVGAHSGTWMEACLTMLANAHGMFPDGATGEGIRLWLKREVGPPHHHNAWGAMINVAIRRHIIIDTGRRTRMTVERSHARKTPIYRWPDDQR